MHLRDFVPNFAFTSQETEEFMDLQKSLKRKPEQSPYYLNTFKQIFGHPDDPKYSPEFETWMGAQYRYLMAMYLRDLFEQGFLIHGQGFILYCRNHYATLCHHAGVEADSLMVNELINNVMGGKK